MECEPVVARNERTGVEVAVKTTRQGRIAMMAVALSNIEARISNDALGLEPLIQIESDRLKRLGGVKAPSSCHVYIGVERTVVARIVEAENDSWLAHGLSFHGSFDLLHRSH